MSAYIDLRSDLFRDAFKGGLPYPRIPDHRERAGASRLGARRGRAAGAAGRRHHPA